MAAPRPAISLPPALAPLSNKRRRRWVLWHWETRKGKRTKPPLRADAPSEYASSTDPSTWSDLPAAMSAYCAGHGDGIGLALKDSGVAAIDLDHCRNKQTGEIAPYAAELIRRAGSYAEMTPSGEGARIIGLGKGKPLHRKFTVPGANGLSVEVYRRAERYITVTGRQISDATRLVTIDKILDGVVAELDNKKPNNAGKHKQKRDRQKHNLDALIHEGCGDDFGGDRSRAVWYVIHQLLKQGKSAIEIARVLLDQANGISAHCLAQPKPDEYVARQIEKAQEHAENGDDTDAEIAQLAALGPVQYEQQRKVAAEKLGLRASILDKLVRAERPENDGKQGRAISLPEPEPWPEPVNGTELLSAIAEAIRKHVVLADAARDTAALWTLHTYLSDRSLVSPRLAITSPTKRCGKTTLLDVLGRLVLKPLPTAHVTPAAIFRTIEAYRPTLLIDEADTFLRDNDELRGIINSGHRKGGSVLRTVGDDHEPRAFATYAACAIALIGRLPETLHDRAVVVALKRRLPSEAITSFRPDRAGHLDELARKAARWAKDHAEQIGEADPEMPDGVFNREADNWRPLLAIAGAAGAPWPKRARAALDAAHTAEDDESRLAMLLADIKTTFAERSTDRLPSASLVAMLVEIEGRPWAEYRAGKPITQNQLARALKPLGIAPQVIREGDSTPRGYTLRQFTEAFERYLAADGAFKPQQRNKRDECSTSDPFQTATRENDVAVQKREKPNNDGLCCGVAVQKGEIGQDDDIVLPADSKVPSRAPGRRCELCGSGGDVWLIKLPDEREAAPRHKHCAVRYWEKHSEETCVCQHCGAPEQPGNPVQECWVGGEQYWLHRDCRRDWLEAD